MRLTLLFFCLFTVSGFAEEAKKVTADKERIVKTVRFLSEENHPRTANLENKEKTIEYITRAIAATGLEPTRDEFKVVFHDGIFTNIHALKKGKTGKRIVVGAHYDIIPVSPGADDNASAVAALIELAYLLKETPEMNCDIELVFYDIEEWGLWGSQHHVKKLKSQKVDVVCMLCMDMVGYFSDKENSQEYPMRNMELAYGTKGNFLAMVGRPKDRTMAMEAKKAFQEAVPLKVEVFFVPPLWEFLFTVSDHAPFWQQKYPALFFTDTADFRNKNYHRRTDTWDTLDYDRLALVPVGLYHVILAIDAAR